jgi:hypothetical protein
MTHPGLLQRLLQGHELLLSSHEAGEPARCSGLQTLAEGTHPDQFKNLHGLHQAFDGKRPERVGLDEAFDQSERGRRQPDAPSRGELFHPRRQVRRLPHGGVVHVQVVTNRPDDNLPRVEADAHLDFQAMGPAHVLRIE